MEQEALQWIPACAGMTGRGRPHDEGRSALFRCGKGNGPVPPPHQPSPDGSACLDSRLRLPGRQTGGNDGLEGSD